MFLSRVFLSYVSLSKMNWTVGIGRREADVIHGDFVWEGRCDY